MGNRTILSLFIMVSAFLFSNVSRAGCIPNQSFKTMSDGSKTIVLIASACVPPGIQPKDYCNSRNATFFGIDGGGFACESKYRGGYKEICEKEFGVIVGHIIGSTGKGSSYRTVSEADLIRCKAGQPPQKPSCDPKQGTWKSSGGRDSVMACYCSDNDLVNVPEEQCGNGTKSANNCDSESQEPNKQGTCDCKKGYEVDKNNTSGPLICKKSGDNSPTVAAPSTSEVSQAMKDCVDPKVEESVKCVSTAEEAKVRCDQSNKDNKEVSTAINQIPSQMGNQYIASKQGQGFQSECMTAGVVANGSRILMESMKKSCETNHDDCTNLCSDQKLQTYLNECKSKFILNDNDQEAVNKGNLAEVQNKDYLYFKANADTIQTNITKGKPICLEDAKKNRGILDSVLGGLARSIQAGASCACQVAASALQTSAAGCSSVPSLAECQQNPSLPLCPAYTAMDICTMGSDVYSSVGCKCQQNPRGQGCPQYVAANPGASGFAGADIKNPASGGIFGPADGGAGGPSGGDNLDLGGAKAEDSSLGAKTGGSGPGFLGGGAGGGAGGGGASAPGGGAPEQAAKEDGEDHKGIGGIFGLAKSVVGSLLGGSKPSTSNEKSLSSKPDMDKFRPKGLRGIAGGNNFGGKNMEIWTMMHSRYGENETSFILAP